MGDSHIMTSETNNSHAPLAQMIKRWGKELGFDHIGITGVNLEQHERWLNQWLEKNYHGEMSYMHRHGAKRSRPDELVEGTMRVISARLDYAPHDIDQAEAVLEQPGVGYISRYALGRDYHKVLRNKLKKLAQKIETEVGQFGYRVFTDSAPVLEKALAENSGLGWIGKHTNLINSKAGSWFFLGEIFVDIPLPEDQPARNHCGSCQRCIELCPTKAIVAPYQVDARRCISYLTIELKGAIPVEFRKAIGNRIYGCDDCQLVCPWNKFAQPTREHDFSPRAHLSDQDLLTLFAWNEDEFLNNTEGSAIRRIGYKAWLRNVAVALGNAQKSDAIIQALRSKRSLIDGELDGEVDKMVLEHIDWALDQQLSQHEPTATPS